jgi:hypothetical protein
MRAMHLFAGAALALTSVWALAQDAPESLLPPGFDQPKPKEAAPRPAPRRDPAPAARPAPAPREAGASAAGSNDTSGGGTSDSGGGSGEVNLSVPSFTSGSDTASNEGAPQPVRKLTLDELEKLSPEDLEAALGLKPRFDMPAAARRALKQIGVIDTRENGLPSASLARQDAGLVRAVMVGNKGMLVSRWGHIMLRRALASRLDAPERMNPADFTALRTALLVRMGEGEVARALVQDIDTSNFTPELTQAAFDAYVATADFTGICPAVLIQGDSRKDPQWQAAQSICSAFRGEGNVALSRLDKALNKKAMPRIDLLLAQKYAGAAGKARRAVKIEWDDVNDMTPWRYGLTLAVGLKPPAALMNRQSARYDYIAATAPMLGLADRAVAADRAAGAGILSSAAMVDLYSQIYSSQDITGDLATRAAALRNAYTAETPNERLAAMQSLWTGVQGADRLYARKVLTAYAAARMPVLPDLQKSAPDLVASMLSAGLDQNALRWADQAPAGGEAWAMLALAAASRENPVEESAIRSFYSDDESENARKTAFLIAGLAGLGRVSNEVRDELASDFEFDLKRSTRWSDMISRAADANNQALVALLAGLGMQGENWSKMTPRHLFHIVSALRQVGLEADARMIAAEAVARG